MDGKTKIDYDEDEGTVKVEPESDDGPQAEESDRSVVLQFRESASSTLDGLSDRTPDRSALSQYRESVRVRVDGVSDRVPNRSSVAGYRAAASSRVDDLSIEVPDRAAAAEYRESAERRIDDMPIKEGFVFGVGAFLFSYVLTLVATASVHAGLETGEAPGVLTDAAGSLLVNLGVGLEQGGQTVSGAEVPGATVGFDPVMALVTVGVVAAAGYLLVKYTGADDLRSAVTTSALIATGYVVLAPLVALFATWSPETGAPISPSTVDALLYAGILVPAVFGIVGGLAATWPEPIDWVLEQIDRLVARVTD